MISSASKIAIRASLAAIALALLVIPGPSEAQRDVHSSPVATGKSTVTVDDARILGSGPFLAYFGGSPHRTVSVAIRNSSTVPMHNMLMVLRAEEKPAVVSGFFSLAAGERRTVSLRVDLRALTAGRQPITGAIGNLSTTLPATFVVTSASYPWGLVAIILAAFLIGTWTFVRRMTGLELAVAASESTARPEREETRTTARRSPAIHGRTRPAARKRTSRARREKTPR